MSARYFFSFILSFISGIIFEEFIRLGFAFGILILALACVVALLPVAHGQTKSVFLVSCILLGFSVGVFRFAFFETNNQSTLSSLVGQNVLLRGVVADEPDVRDTYTNLTVRVDEVTRGNQSAKLSERVLVRVDSFPQFSYGDAVTISGKIKIPESAITDEAGRTFNYQTYLAKSGIYTQIYFPRVELVAHKKGNFILQNLFAFKHLLLQNIATHIPDPEASLAGGILLGIKQSLGADLLQKFRETGVAHIIVLSGYNIAVVAGVLSRVSLVLPLFGRLATSVLGITLFALMVGTDATVVRATLMALIVIVLRAVGREGRALRVLAFAGALMVLFNPLILLHDLSFELSFLATLALIVLVPILERYFLWVHNRIVREILTTTFATQIAVFPLILYQMGSVSLIGPLTNLFVLPVIPFAMFVSAFLAVLAWVPLMSNILTFVVYVTLAYVVGVVELFAKIPLASLSGISFPLVLCLALYALIVVWVMKKFPRESEKKGEPLFEF